MNLQNIDVLVVAGLEIITVITYVILSRQDKVKVKLRRIPALDAIDEAIGRAAETGRPLIFSHGTGGYSGGLQQATQGAVILAGLSCLTYIVDGAVKKGVPIICSVNHAETLPIYHDILSTAYKKENLLEEFNPEYSIRYISPFMFSYVAGTMALMRRERPAASFLLGIFFAESLLLSAAGNEIGAMQIGGCESIGQTSYFVATCDYTLIGEELFAAGVYLSQDPIQTASIGAQDLVKMIVMVIIAVMNILTTSGIAVSALLSALLRS